MRASNCANIEGVFRIIQAIPSPQAEPFKRWLAQVGYERVKEIENPELAMGRMQELYEKKGYPKEWIDKRLRGQHVPRRSTPPRLSSTAATRGHPPPFLNPKKGYRLPELRPG